METADARPLSPWLESVPLVGAPLRGDIETEVVVVGAGGAGLAAAAALAEAGRAVVVLERRSVGSGLSGRGAGTLLASSGRWLARDERELGLAKAQARRALALRGRERARPFAEKLPHFDACGSTMVALSPREWSDAQRTAELVDGLELFERDAARTGSPLFGGGAFEAADFCVDPAALLRALAAAAIARGARLCEGTQVMRVEEPSAGGVLVRTARGVVRAGMVVLAVNAWTPELVPNFGDRVKAHRAQWLLAPSRRGPAAGSEAGGLWLANHGHESWRKLASGALLFGGCRETSAKSEDLLSEESTGKIQGMMERFVTKAFGIPELAVTHRWAGAAASTCDGLPVIGPLPGHGGVVLCCGFGEHELALSIGAGMQTADLVQAGRVESAELFSARRFL